MNTITDNAALMRLGALLHLVDPTLPIGGFNHSGGLETFVQQGVIADAGRLKEYVQVQLTQNWVYNDGAYVSLAFDAAAHRDLAALLALDEKIGAAKSAREIREGSFKLGVRLLKIFARHERADILHCFQTALTAQQAKGYFPLAFGLTAACMGLDKAQTLYAFYYNAAVGAVTNGVKLIPLSQMAGQDILFELRTAIADAVAASLTPDPEWIGAATLAADIRAMQHERLYTRLYMS
ncbi:urease accessory protein UreF [Uruburuella testudinis]|uniref:Urease accessory protein UreF n=1 Tax=Uruburuella testudinis TaxID=1282863 RepID=A0ABY4DWU2_9NEIS|nr:urease accessory protein UreF [Uruburuella testudinis]UOO82077.1 urease accessory protein UreF [Uruburuella testudinis]